METTLFCTRGCRAKPPPEHLATADRNSSLNLLPACPCGVVFQVEKGCQPRFLIVANQSIVPGKGEGDSEQGKYGCKPAQLDPGREAHDKKHEEKYYGRPHILLK